MRKILKNKDLNERSASRTLLAVALAASLSTLGCTTNWNRGNGEPATGSTNVNSPSATPGSSGGTVPQPMTSSSRLTNTPEEALAIMQQTLPTTRGRVLGPVNPPATGAARGASNEALMFDGTHQWLTINSSIANPLGPQAAIVNGDSSDAGVIFNNTTVTGTTAPVTAAGTTGSVTATSASTPAITTATTGAATPISAALPITSGSLAAGTGNLTPTASSSVVPSATASTSAQRLNRATVGTTSSTGLSVTQTAAGKVVISNVK